MSSPFSELELGVMIDPQCLINPSSEGKLQSQDDARVLPSSTKSGLRLVAKDSLLCSSNKTAMHLVALLETTMTSKTVDERHQRAASHVLKAVNLDGERLFCGNFCDALNSLLDDGTTVLHQGCIGPHNTHSDISARNIRRDGGTLMVGKAKDEQLWSSEIRKDTRGQLFNELIRHRSMDATKNSCRKIGRRPILLLSFDKAYIFVDLVFPSNKGSAMETGQWVSFNSDVSQGQETFWTIQVASVCYAGIEGRAKLPKIIRFIAEAIQYLGRITEFPPQQFKTPCWGAASDEEDPAVSAAKCGKHVTIITTKSGKKRVVKEFCYYLRKHDGVNELQDEIEEEDQRQPPSEEILEVLRKEYPDGYASWQVDSGPFGIQILFYDHIEGDCLPTKDSWMDVLKQVEIMHNLGYVHGDLLPRNTLFTKEGSGFVIDFDLARKEGEPYVRGYNHKDFSYFRHPGACQHEPMHKAHDVWSLIKMTEYFFGMKAEGLDPKNVVEVSDLIELFSD